MQKERLVIKNFGPIKSIDLELGKMTILIGEQATGKSTIAKVLAVCRYFSYIADFRTNINLSNEQFFEGLKNWELDGYLLENSEIYFENSDYSFQVKNKKITETEVVTDLKPLLEKIYFEQETKFTPKSEKAIELTNELQETKNAIENNFFNGWFPSEKFFRLDVSKVISNPFYIPTERGLQSIFSLGKSSIQNISDSLFNQFAKMDMFARAFKNETEIKPLNILYKNVNGQGFVKNERQTEFSSLYNGASGYQSIIPVVLAVKYYSENKRKKKTFIIEEPELNLFPKAQKKLMEFFVENINTNGHSFLLPTHSPYIVSTLGNLIYAHKIGNLDNKKYSEEVKKSIPEKYWLNINDISAYYLENGEAKNLVNTEECLINLDNLDSVSEIINKEFDELLNLEVQFENIDL